MPKLKHADLVKTATDAKARWRVTETPVALLDEAKQAALLGVIPSAEVTAAMTARAAAPQAAAPPAFAPAVDWRNHNGNHVSAVKNQGGCGSCVSFACTAVTESMGHIERGTWVDLSEADSHFCSSHGANCGGWWPDQCIDQFKSRGVCDDACFPYASAFPNGDIWATPPACHVRPDRDARAVKVTNRVQLSDATAAKNHLSSIGPVAGCIDVYQDFFSYGGGVYHHVSGSLAGGHCMEVIGYSEAEQCWIVKNSWDTTWGIGGFGKIAYADFKFNGQFYPMYGVTGVSLPSTSFQSLGGVLTSRAVAGRNKDGRLEVFARGTDNALWHIWQAPNGSWSGWASLGGSLGGDPQVVSNADGRLEVFARGTNNALMHVWQTAPNNGWSTWASLGGVITSNPACGRNKDGRVEVFARGADGALWHIWQVAPNGGWSGWTSLGAQMIGHPTVGRNLDDRLEVFFRGTNGAVLHVWQTAPSNGWSNWASLGGVLTSDPAIGRNRDGRLEVFARGADGACWHIWQTAANNGWATGWASLGGVISSPPAVASNQDGRLEVFARGMNAACWHVWQTAAGGGWSGWSSLGGVLSDGPFSVSNADGRLEVFARGVALNLIHTWQAAPNNGWN